MAVDQYINATHVIDKIDAALAKLPPRCNAKSIQDLAVRVTLGTTKQLIQKELQVGEFRPVVHAHWVFKYGNYSCSECGNHSIDRAEGSWRWDGEDDIAFCPFCGATMDEPDED